MPRWIDHQSTKAERQKAAEAALKERAMRRAAEKPEREAFHAELIASKAPGPVRRGVRPGERRLPDLSDEELAVALGQADRALPRHLAYPHLLILRERGYTKMIYADCGRGEFGAPSYRGDVITEVGEQWLNQQTGGSRTAT